SAARPTRSLASRSSHPGLSPVPPVAGSAISLDGFHFLDCLGRGPLGEQWRIETAEGEPRLVKLINTFTQLRRDEEEGRREEEMAGQLRAIQHRGLLPATILAHTANRLAVITAPVREGLASLLQEYQGRGRMG